MTLEQTSGPDGSSPTAAVILIGNELLSGRTTDANLAYIASGLAERGIRVAEARVIPDEAEVIIDCVNTMRARYTYVFTSGGIGPTHDDITADCIAEAFGVELPVNQEARSRLLAYYAQREVEVNEDRLRMARIPEGASLIDNPVSIAPGFQLQNVFVFAGVPRIMQAMFQNVLPSLKTGPRLHVKTIVCNLAEGTIAGALRQLQQAHPEVDIGSYPGNMPAAPAGRSLSLVVKSHDRQMLDRVSEALLAAIDQLDGKVVSMSDKAAKT